MTQPPAGHPEPDPAPAPSPDPEPPHASGADFIDAPPPDQPPVWPPVGAFAGDARPTEVVDVGRRDTEELHPEEFHPGHQQPGDQHLTEPVAVWHQPPPSEPWHAQHEKPGEWHTTPPDHLAYHHSPPAEVVDQPAEIVHAPQPPWQVPLQPQDDNDARRRRTGMWLSVALTVTVLLCGGGAFSAYLLLRDADGTGAPDPGSAVNEFMTAIYTRQDASAAAEMVCREARDASRLTSRVDQIRGLATEYQRPTFRWNEPAVSAQTEERATVSVQLTLTTDDEKTADQQLTFTTVRKTGWLVCEISG